MGAVLQVVHLCNVALSGSHPDAWRLKVHPGRWVLNLAIAQRKYAGLDARILMHVPGASQHFETEMEGVPVRFLAVPDRWRSATLFFFDRHRLAGEIRRQGADFVHAHGTEDAYSLAAQSTGLPYVITAQGLFFLINRHLPPRKISRERIVEFTERLALSRARDVIAKSDYVGAELERQFPHLRVHRIPNTLDERLSGIAEPKASRVLAFVGTVTPRKGLDLLGNAIAIVQARMPDLRLWIFGDHGPDCGDEYEKTVRRRLTELMGDRVVFHGILPGIEVARKVSEANALVAPSIEEMFGNQLVESLAVGTHGIVTDGTAMAENVRRYGNGTVVPQGDSKALAHAIENVLTSPPSHSEIESAQRNLWSDLGPSAVANRHAALYRELL